MSDYWWQQRLDDAVWTEREARGLCGNCGRPLGDALGTSDHACPRVPSTSEGEAP